MHPAFDQPPSVEESVKRELVKLQRFYMALEKIREIGGPAGDIAKDALEGRPRNLGGTVYG